jgi:ribosomal protein S12 methylthiotransferase
MADTGYRVSLISLGCPKNLVDSEVMLGLLQEAGYEITGQPAAADILLVNTCGFIGDAKQESIATILEYAAYKQTARCRHLVVTGCLAQRYPAELLAEIPEIDAIVGTGDYPQIVRILRETTAGKGPNQVGGPELPETCTLPRVRSTPSYTAYLKIAEGCGHRCSYCIIPQLRGPLQSRPLEAVTQEARAMAEAGVREIILIAQDTTQYGIDRYGSPQLATLLTQLAAIEPLQWIRLLYAYPTNFPPELITVLAREPKICNYLDLPLQHCNDEILRRMYRKTRKADIIRLISDLRDKIPGIALRTTFIVGFPGETEAQFTELLDFIRDMEFDRVGIFAYSQEEGTPAGALPDQVPEAVKSERYHRAMSLQQGIARAANQQMIGRELLVLTEGKSSRPGYSWSGRSYRDAPEIDGLVHFRHPKCQPGEFIRVTVTGADAYDLLVD